MKTLGELFTISKETEDAIGDQLRSLFFSLAEVYVEQRGAKAGMEDLCEDLFTRVAPKFYPDGWSGLVKHAMKISG